jgi:pyrroloquinoline-quinone synthase
MDREKLFAALRAVGEGRYHHRHPFHRRMNAGALEPAEVRRWVANRYYYQLAIPLKDAAILSNCPVRAVRRVWIHRIMDHDGREGEAGGIEKWLRLGEGCGMERSEIEGCGGVVPGVRFAVDAYVNFARTKPWPVAIASSLTELFAPDLMAERLAAFRKHYPWVAEGAFEYFEGRVTQARVDADEALEFTLRYCDTVELQREAVAALEFKCDVLWAVLDAIAGEVVG